MKSVTHTITEYPLRSLISLENTSIIAITGTIEVIGQFHRFHICCHVEVNLPMQWEIRNALPGSINSAITNQ